LVDPALGAKRIEGGAVRSVVKKPTGWRGAKKTAFFKQRCRFGGAPASKVPVIERKCALRAGGP